MQLDGGLARPAPDLDPVRHQFGIEVPALQQSALHRELARFVLAMVQYLALARVQAAQHRSDAGVGIGLTLDADIGGTDSHRLATLHRDLHRDAARVAFDRAGGRGLVVAIGLQRTLHLALGAAQEVGQARLAQIVTLGLFQPLEREQGLDIGQLLAFHAHDVHRA
ncbi:MAG: hypothetical protein LKM39_16660 [Chiayiivirga sp.]|nr:hypothetical protein [Chiayiivirga sp.]